MAIAAFAITALFAVVTLPVEFDASKRALAWLETSGTAVGVEHEGAKTTLWWAAMTYVAAALGGGDTVAISTVEILSEVAIRYRGRCAGGTSGPGFARDYTLELRLWEWARRLLLFYRLHEPKAIPVDVDDLEIRIGLEVLAAASSRKRPSSGP